MSQHRIPGGRAPDAQRLFQAVIFGSRWLLAPFYVGLIVGLLVLLLKFAQETLQLLAHALSASDDQIIVGVLSLVDLSLIGNLLVMVVFAGYESFVSRLELGTAGTRLGWMGRIGFSELKLKLMATIVAIAAIRVLEGFMTAGQRSERELAWMVGILLAFVVAGVLLAAMDRLSHDAAP